ncbi:CvpA family protein [bacterium]|nr:CvpA family protein [bacterium]MBU1073963.1 CvpA family protein [bacterium]MBU1674861.1 CvpA family protein [bacterium]
MHWLTIATLALLLVFAVAGWRAGLIRRVLEFVGMVASVLLASRYCFLAADWLQDTAGLEDRWARPLGWLLVFAALLLVAKLAAWSLAKALRVSVLGWVDRWGGALLGMLIGVLVCSVLLMLACRITGDDDLAKQVRSDPVTRIVHGAAPTLYAFVVRGDHEDLERLWQRARDGFEELPDPGEAASSLREAVSDRLDEDRE